jgi:hypothetical protein
MDGFLKDVIGKILAKLGATKLVFAATKALTASGDVQKTAIKLTKTAVKTVAKKTAGAVEEKTKEAISDTIQMSAINQIIGWLWDKILKAGKALTDGIAFMVGLPGKISSIIGDISNKASTTIEKILAGGLSNIVKPLTDVLDRLVNKFLKPKIEAAQKWLERQIKTNSAVKEVLAESKSNFQGVPPSNPKSAIKVEKLKADEKDLKRLKSLPPLNKGLRKGAENAAEDTKKVDTKKSSDGKDKKQLDVKKSSENKGSKEISKDKKIKESFGFFDSQILGFDDFILSY